MVKDTAQTVDPAVHILHSKTLSFFFTKVATTGSLSEVELQQQEIMTEDSLSNDEYDCASPDDISLPPLAETPESTVIQSDVEEGLCFSSHSIQSNQYSHQCRAQSEHGDAGIIQQHRVSSQTEGCPTPPNSLHSSTRSV